MAAIFFLLSLAVDAVADAIAETPMGAGDHLMALTVITALRNACDAGTVDLEDIKGRLELLDDASGAYRSLMAMARAISAASRSRDRAANFSAKAAVKIARANLAHVRAIKISADAVTVVESTDYVDCIEFRPVA